MNSISSGLGWVKPLSRGCCQRKLAGGFESAHLSFSHPSGLMRNLDAMVGKLLGIVGNARQDRSSGSTIALQRVGDDPEGSLP